MKKLIPSSLITFDPTSQSIVIDGPEIKLEQLLLITNVTRSVTLFLFDDPNLSASLTYDLPSTETTIVLFADVSGFDAADSLQIFYDDLSDIASNPKLDELKSVLDDVKTALDSIVTNGAKDASLNDIKTYVDGLETLVSTLNGYVDGIEGNQSTLNGLISTLNGYVDGLEGYTDGIEALATTQNSLITSTNSLLTTIGGYLDGLEGYTDGLESLATTQNSLITTLQGYVDGLEGLVTTLNGKDFATQTTLAQLSAKFGAIGQQNMAGSAPVVIASNQSAIPVTQSTIVNTIIQRFKDLGSNVTANIKAAAGNVFSLTCYNDNILPRYLQMHDKASAAAAGDVPVGVFLVPAKGQIIIGDDYFTKLGLSFSTGITFAFSTTRNTYTAGAAADQSTMVNYL